MYKVSLLYTLQKKHISSCHKYMSKNWDVIPPPSFFYVVFLQIIARLIRAQGKKGSFLEALRASLSFSQASQKLV